MWFKKYWPAMLGIALQAGSIWKFIKWALDWRGRYDALAATYHETGGASAVIGYILNPPPWFYPVAFVVGFALIWWNFQRVRSSRKEAVELAKPSEFAAPNPAKPPVLPKPLKELFGSDFPNQGKKFRPVPVTFENSQAIDCVMQVHQDFVSGVEFMSLYIPKCGKAVEVCEYFANNFRSHYDQLRIQIHLNVPSPGEPMIDRSIDLALSPRLYVYHEDEIDYDGRARVTGLFRILGLIAKLRGQAYRNEEWRNRLLAQTA